MLLSETIISPLSPPNADADTYQRRLKRVVVPMGNVYRWLISKGEWATNVGGWPQDARVVGATIQRAPFALVLYLYHTDFPPVLSGEPPALELRWNRVG